jgi:hypothetical protein
LFELERYSALAFSIPIKGGQISATVGDAIDFFGSLSAKQRGFVLSFGGLGRRRNPPIGKGMMT